VSNGPGYTGHVQDAATGLVYMQQRYYDAQIGRFLSMDPVTTNSATGANFNRYWYADNNPYTFIDPTGRCTGSRIENKDGTCRSTGGNTTETYGARQGEGRSTVSGFGSGFVHGGPGNISPYLCDKGGDCGPQPYVSPADQLIGTAAAGAIVVFPILLSDPLIASLFVLGSAPQAVSDGMPPGFNVVASGGAKVTNLAFGDALRIQNAVNRTGVPVTVVGSRARGAPGPLSDWDYVIPAGTPSRTRHSLGGSLPSGHRALGEPRNQDLFMDPLNTRLPYITFSPVSR
jgi:RHS repeat-associated protein